MYPLSKSQGLNNKKRKKQQQKQDQINLSSIFQPKFQSFQYCGYQFCFSLITPQTIKVQAISLSALKSIHKQKKKRQKNQESQQQQQTQEQQEQDQFSFHYTYEYQITQEWLNMIRQQEQGLYGYTENQLLQKQNLNKQFVMKPKHTQNVQAFFRYIKLLLDRYRYQIKCLKQEQFKKFEINNSKQIDRMDKKLQERVQKERNQFLANFDQLVGSFKSKYIQVQEEGRDFDNRHYQNLLQNQMNQKRRQAKLQSGMRIKEQYGSLKLNKKSFLVLKFKNIFQKQPTVSLSAHPSRKNSQEGEQALGIDSSHTNPRQLNNYPLSNVKILKTQYIENSISTRSSPPAHYYQLKLKSRILQSFQFSHRMINYNFKQYTQLQTQFNQFVNYKLIKTQQQLFKKTYDFIQELRSIADGFQKEAIQNILSKLNTSLKVRRQKKSKFKEIPEQFAVNGVHATFEYRNTGNQKQPRQEEQQVVKENYQPELQILDKKTDAVKIPIQFDQQSGSYHQFSISDNVVSRNGGSSYQILHFKYRLSYKSRYTCTMRLIKTYRRVCWIGIMQQQTKNFIHTSKMQNCIVYHTCHGRIETHLKKQQGLEVKKKKARGMTTLYDGHWVRMLIQMDRWQIQWQLYNGVKARCRIPDQLRGMSLRPVVILQIINDTVEFIDL